MTQFSGEWKALQVISKWLCMGKETRYCDEHLQHGVRCGKIQVIDILNSRNKFTVINEF